MDVAGADENLGAWLCQDYLVNGAQGRYTRKYLASTGDARHVVIEEFDGIEVTADLIVNRAAGDWAADVADSIQYPVGDQWVAQRVWPGL